MVGSTIFPDVGSRNDRSGNCGVGVSDVLRDCEHDAARSRVDPSHRPTVAIVTGGPFRFSRNPIYLSMILLQIGIGVWTNSSWFFVLAAMSVGLLTWGVIR